MLAHQDLDTRESANSFYAALDARMRNAVGKLLYSDSKLLVADQVCMGLQRCYNTNSVYINYRKKFISLKVSSDHELHDAHTLSLFEHDWQLLCMTKLISAQGTIYRIPA